MRATTRAAVGALGCCLRSKHALAKLRALKPHAALGAFAPVADVGERGGRGDDDEATTGVGRQGDARCVGRSWLLVLLDGAGIVGLRRRAGESVAGLG